jgi:hypothetical protein
MSTISTAGGGVQISKVNGETCGNFGIRMSAISTVSGCVQSHFLYTLNLYMVYVSDFLIGCLSSL